MWKPAAPPGNEKQTGNRLLVAMSDYAGQGKQLIQGLESIEQSGWTEARTNCNVVRFAQADSIKAARVLTQAIVTWQGAGSPASSSKEFRNLVREAEA